MRVGSACPLHRRHARRLTIALVSLLLLGLRGPLSSQALGGQSALRLPISPSLRAAVQQRGRARVIVGLRIRVQAEGHLRGPERATQRRAIRELQDRLLAKPHGRAARAVKRFSLIPFIAMEVDGASLAALASDADVATIAEDRPVRPLDLVSQQLVEAPRAWEAGYSGSGQAIAILDTGVDLQHPFLAGKVVAEGCYSSTDPSYSSTSLCPDGSQAQVTTGAGANCDSALGGCEHGTHVAGIAAGVGAEFSGVARDAQIIAIQVFSRFDTPTYCPAGPCVLSFISDQVRGLERVVALHNTYAIAAANLSLGSGYYSDQAACDADQENAVTKAAIDTLRSYGIATVVAAGNDGYTGGLSAPACISSAISVGSTTAQDRVSSFSNSAAWLLLLAPGEKITSSVPGGGFVALSGTSMAAPHVAGAWAVLKSQWPAASVDDVLAALRRGPRVLDCRNRVMTPRIALGSALGLVQATGPIRIFLPLIGTAGDPCVPGS